MILTTKKHRFKLILELYRSFSSPSATSSSNQSMGLPAKANTPPIQIPIIPPFRRHENQHSNYPTPPTTNQFSSSQSTVSMSVSPPRISEIPPFNKQQRKSREYVFSDQLSHDGSHPEHQLTIGAHGAEWTRRLKVAEQSPIHRSTDCIVSKDLGTSSDSELLKPAPSWTNVALKTEQAGTSKKNVFRLKSF
jgi:anoctamin-8